MNPATTVLGLVLAAAGASASVEEAAGNGFLVRHDVQISAPPAQVFATIVERVGEWWNPSHTWSGDSRNLSIDPRPGGCFCEKLADGGGLEHLRVIYVAPGKLLRLSGGLGPLQGSGVSGSLTWTLKPSSLGTTLVLSYSVGGFMAGGLDKLATAVDGMLAEQLQRLKGLIQSGKP